MGITNPEAIAEARRLIEAGETVAIETLETPAADPSQNEPIEEHTSGQQS
jgi:hypothetical protein